jgi:hypothetical protein
MMVVVAAVAMLTVGAAHGSGALHLDRVRGQRTEITHEHYEDESGDEEVGKARDTHCSLQPTDGKTTCQERCDRTLRLPAGPTGPDFLRTPEPGAQAQSMAGAAIKLVCPMAEPRTLWPKDPLTGDGDWR